MTDARSADDSAGYAARAAAEAYAGDRPLCFCHREPMTWGRTSRLRAGGSWRCAVRARDAVRRARERRASAE